MATSRETGRRARSAALVAVALLLPAPARPEAQAFVPYRYVDPVAGVEAFRALVPRGWQVEGGIHWSADPALPATSRFRFHDPASGAELNLFPTQAFFWTDNRLFLATNPPGSLRFNTRVARPVGLDEALARMVVARFRPDVRDLAVVRRERVPELARLARGKPEPGTQVDAEAGKVRLTYTQGGKEMEEEFYAAVSQVIIPMPASPPYYIEYWYVDHVFSFRAPRGGLEPRSRTFQTMIYSFQVDPRWFAKVANTREALVARMMRGIRIAGEVGSTVAAASSSLREDQMRDWERRQAARDRVAQAQSDGIRGVERFHDPHAGKEVELPAGYGRAWANPLGEYVVSDSPSYNPNVGSNLHWEEMPAVR